MPGLVRRFYRNLALGYSQIAPPRAMDPEGDSGLIYRDALNWIERDGVLTHRLGLQTYSGTAIPYQVLTGTGNDIEMPVHIHVIPGRELTYGTGSRCTIVVTNRNIWLQPDQSVSWIKCTPTYTTGTLTATNGSANLTGSGTAWQTDGITPGAFILIDGTTYTITGVTSDTAATITPVFGGTTGAGKSYTITRVFPGGDAWSVANDIFTALSPALDTLYVAGTYTGTSNSGTGPRPAVIKVSGIFSATPVTTYITARTALVSGLDFVSDLTRVAGLKALQDGRVVVAGGDAIVFYSSHLNDAVWTVSPAGQTLVNLSNSRINAMGGVGNVTTLYDDTGVVLAYPTGLSDPPFRYQRSRANLGIHFPRTLREIGGAEIGLTASGEVIRFDLDRSVVISDAIHPSLEALNYAQGLAFNVYHASVNLTRSEYTLVVPPFSGSSSVTTGWTLQMSTGNWWPWSYNAPIGTISTAPTLNPSTAKIHSIAGLYSLDGTTERALLAFLRADYTADDILYGGATTSTFRFTTEDLDFGFPEQLKAAHRLVLWGYRTASGTVAVTVSVSRDGGAAWTALSAQNWPSTSGVEAALQFSFDPLTPGAGQALRFRVEVATAAFVVHFRRMLVEALDSGMIEQVEL